MSLSVDNISIAIIALGHVGLPLAVEFGKKHPTLGFDINKKRVGDLQKWHDITLEVSSIKLADSAFIHYASEVEALTNSNV